ncbi:leucine--tRNA ligase [Nanoarchaeota archaeon]
MVNFKALAKKWQDRWEKDKVFQVEVDDREKYYIAIVYPYMSGLLHLGHLFTYTTSEIQLRYKRMRGFNTLAKFGFHCTGTPIVAAAQRVKENEPGQIQALKKMGIAEKEIPKFSEPEYWTTYFPKETLKDVKSLGFSIDERYAFKTTHLNPPYDSFITWQFNQLHEKGYVKKGKHPVVWCPKDNLPVGDHDRAEGEGETPKDFIWGKFRLKNSDLILMAGTTRPDAFYGQTHLWIDPDGDYQIVEVEDEKWVVGKEAVKKIEEQYAQTKVIRDIKPEELIGQWTRGPLVDYDTYVVPAWFIDSKVGSGIVFSALEDPVDLFELKKIHSDMALLDKYNLDKEVVAKLKPISIIDVPDMGDNLGEDIGKEFGVKSPDDKEKIEAAKNELNKRVFRKGIMKDNCGECAGLTVPECQEFLKKQLTEKGEAVMFYELTDKVVCRCLTECIIKMVSDQWFIQYNDPAWKKITHQCLDQMKLYPEQVRKQFDYVLDWLHRWACTRELGLGTKLPWDQKWVVESLSDSTIQMAYGTISKYLQNPEDYGFSIDNLNDEFFSYVFLNKGDAESVEKSTQVPKEMIETMKRDFEYWYPFDFRNSAKDLIQNHLAFCLFNHTALFPEKHWPRAYALNGRIMVDNQKMSKSKGNFFTARELYEKHGADIVRLTSANAGEGIDDANFDMNFLETATKKLNELFDFVQENYNQGREERLPIDNWFESVINNAVKETTQHMENIEFKSAILKGFLDLQRHLRWYSKRTDNHFNKKLINHFIETQIKLLAPFTPHLCEEMWSLIKGQGYVSKALWPEFDRTKINRDFERGEELIDQVMTDINTVLKLAKITQPQKITLITSSNWKYKFMKILKQSLTETRDFKDLLNKTMIDDLKQHGKDITKIIPKYVKLGSVPEATNQELENKTLEHAKDFLSKKYSNTQIEVINAEDSKESKANQAMPGKPAILVN